MPQTIDNLVATWNNAATTFTAFKFNITDTASNAASLLMDLQVGGSSVFRVSKTAAIAPNGSVIAGGKPGLTFLVNANTGIAANAENMAFWESGTISLNIAHTLRELRAASDYKYSWSSATNNGAAADLFLTRRAAANLRLGAADAAAPVAQTLSVQSVVAGTSNTAGANLTITGSQGTGTGAGGSIIFQVAPAGSSGTAQNALATALTINSAGTATFNGVVTANSGFSSGANILLSTNGGQLYFGSGNDLILARDAANTLALRNGTNPQTFRVYNTTDGTNSGWFEISANASSTSIYQNKAGSGGNRNLLVGTSAGSGGTLVLVEGGTWRWYLNNGHLFADTDNLYDIGASGANRPRNVYVGGFLGVAELRGGATRASPIALCAPLVDFVNAGGGFIFRITPDASTNKGVVTFSDDSNSFNRIQFGGTTSSYPALKRSTTALQARLADDSAFTAIQGKLTTDTAYTAGDPTTTGYLVVYDSTGTAYKIPAVAV